MNLEIKMRLAGMARCGQRGREFRGQQNEDTGPYPVRIAGVNFANSQHIKASNIILHSEENGNVEAIQSTSNLCVF